MPTPKNPLGVAIIGCGLIGRKRACALPPSMRLLVACDLEKSRAEELSRSSPGCVAITNYQQAIEHPAVDLVVVCTLNSALASIGLAAVQAKKHVLLEKPGAIRATELQAIEAATKISGVQVWIGYNHRFHPALQKARQLVSEGAIGELMFLRGRYGHGGRTGYDREWRANPTLSGGGELMDQGVHLIDLARWFLGPFTTIEGHVTTSYWDMQVDDNAFLSLRTPKGQTAWLHASCTEWKNLFSFEIYGRNGKLAIDGLGGSYGLEKLAFYKMLPEMGPPETTVWEYPRGDRSWYEEFETIHNAIQTGLPSDSLREGIETLRIVETVYARSGCNFS